MNEEQKVGHVFGALAAVKLAISKTGIEKSGYNMDQGYNFRGIDDVMDAFAGPLAENKIMACPVYSNLEHREYKTSSGKPYHFWDIEVSINFVSLVDGSSFIVGPFYAEASDTQDKGKTKVQSVAFRIGMLLSFQCPVGPEADPEAYAEVDTIPKGQPANSEWIGAIKNAETEEQVRAIGDKLKAAEGIPERDLREIRGAWAAKLKEVSAAKASGEGA